MAILYDNRPLCLGHLSVPFSLISMEHAVMQLAKGMSSQKKRQIISVLHLLPVLELKALQS